MKPVNSVSILGCGWLGLPLARQLLGLGYRVKGSTTTAAKLTSLQQSGVIPYLIGLTDNEYDLQKLNEFLDTDVLVIAVPPGRTDERKAAYIKLFKTISALIPVAEKNIKQLILISSTSVYAESNEEIDEAYPAEPHEPAGIIVREVEQMVERFNIPAGIIRFGGLIGPERHPGRFFAGKKNIANGLSPVNLIHLDDAVNIVIRMIETNQTGILNACAPTHPSRQDFYSLASASLGLEPPSFIPELISWKRIKCSRLENSGYHFIHPDLLRFLEFNAGKI